MSCHNYTIQCILILHPRCAFMYIFVVIKTNIAYLFVFVLFRTNCNPIYQLLFMKSANCIVIGGSYNNVIYTRNICIFTLSSLNKGHSKKFKYFCIVAFFFPFGAHYYFVVLLSSLPAYERWKKNENIKNTAWMEHMAMKQCVNLFPGVSHVMSFLAFMKFELPNYSYWHTARQLYRVSIVCKL